jgi:hypothetical protein
VSVIGRSGSASGAAAAEAVFLMARGPLDTDTPGGLNPNPKPNPKPRSVALGGADWSCTVGAMCKAGNLERAAELLVGTEG